jgi:hypothetical protein
MKKYISPVFEPLERMNQPILKFLWSKYKITKPIPKVRVVGIIKEWIFSNLWKFLKSNVILRTSKVEYTKESLDEIKTEVPIAFNLKINKMLLELFQRHKMRGWIYLKNYDYVIFLNLEKIIANAHFNRIPEYQNVVLELLHEDVHIVEYHIGKRLIKNYDNKYLQPEIIYQLQQEFYKELERELNGCRAKF